MVNQPLFKGISQVCAVVRDLDAAVKEYWDKFGIGPWSMYTLDKSNVTDMLVRERRIDYAMRIALARIGDVEWELIQPLDDKTIYAEFLNTRGEGLHHVCFSVEDYDGVIRHFRSKGIGVVQGGTWQGCTFTYLESEGTLSFVAEVFKMPEGYSLPTPEAMYP